MLVEFTRVNSIGEVDEPARFIGLNPLAVGAVHDSAQHADTVIIRLFDGRGYMVRGSYAEVKARLDRVEPDPANPQDGLHTIEGSELQ